MKLQLNKPFASNSAVEAHDVQQAKRVLNRLGYYTPPKTVGNTHIPDRSVFTALTKFQKEKGLRATGEMKPGDATEKALNDAQDEQEEKGGSYIWHTMQDGKVRAEHAALEGQVFSWDSPPEDGHPGEPYNCRCWAEPIKDAIKPVYPELWLFPALGLSKIVTLWKIWNSGQKWEWSLGKHKSSSRWQKQLEKRNWPPEQITETIKNGKQHPAPNKVHSANPAKRYEYKGRYVVRDEVTKEILQIGEAHFKRPAP